ncbi:uncharacterized protein N7459_008933 [Penicillium hispanicum]|uniref:uncharacterized protein n=1 Tax=Penicillium hispanicum TaxID=1080232 RepID=UPI0025423292|nr:uncharacterized protein N7459_008933 [Penicillium hispanicum]KAJ5569503.1 hypothetical protein N7459_008933 [Penicillium hispanicum]
MPPPPHPMEAACLGASGGNDVVVLACGLEKEVNQLLCYLSNCWNKVGANLHFVMISCGSYTNSTLEVYSCEYQYLASAYLIARTAENTVPFYPAPANAPGSCSCNMGNILKNATASPALIQNKCSSYTLTEETSPTECQCCSWSAALSSRIPDGICPNTDPTRLGIHILASEVKDALTITGTCFSLNADTCLGKFEIGSADNGTYLDLKTSLSVAPTR